MKFIVFIFVLSIWCANALSDDTVEYVIQILEPTGGKIEKPKDWFYRERHGGPYLMWILAEEDPDKGPYNTGIRIQLIRGIKDGTGKLPEVFISDFIESKKLSSKIISECKVEDHGLFYRRCLETIEFAVEGTGVKSHIQYSLFWNNELDTGIFVTAGTSDELWDQKKDIFRVMEAFEFIDMKRFD